jgi:hypothetical protein
MKAADLFVGFLDDRKVQRAVRLAGSDAVVAYLAVVLGSARDEDRATFADELPLYLEDRADELLAVLVRVGLLEADGTVAGPAFDRWIAPGIRRAGARREYDRRRNRHGPDTGPTRAGVGSRRPVPSRPSSNEDGTGERAHTRATPASPPVAASPPTSLPTDTDDDLDDDVLERYRDDDDTDGTRDVASWPAPAAGDGRDDLETTRRAETGSAAVLGRPGRSYAELLEHAEPGSFLASVAERRRRAVAGSP